LLQNLFDEVQIEVLLQNATSSRFTPLTGVLQGSVLSPHLYSIYINDLPQLLRQDPLPQTIDSTELASVMNCLLYADDVALIADQTRMITLLKKCEEHSYSLGYRWNPSKCVILDPNTQKIPYQLYGHTIPVQSSFAYLGVPFRPGGYLHPLELVTQNTNKALASLNQLAAIGLNPRGFDTLLSTRFYAQIIRPQLEYGLAINKITSYMNKKLEDAQNQCVRRIFGGSVRSSVQVMLHLTELPTMQERTHILQAQFLMRSSSSPADTLISHLLPLICLRANSSQWHTLSKTPLWRQCSSSTDTLDKHTFKVYKRQFLQDNLDHRRSSSSSMLLSKCRPKISTDPILWLPMTRSERSRCIRWRLGWLPGGKPSPCPRHPTCTLTKQHAIHCLEMHRRLYMPSTISDPLSFLLNLLPMKKPSVSAATSWFSLWPVICIILFELDHLHHQQEPPSLPLTPGQSFIHWLPSSTH
jgi:hypothetical protein